MKFSIGLYFFRPIKSFPKPTKNLDKPSFHRRYRAVARN